MPRVSVSQRTRQTLFRLFRNPVFTKSGLAGYCQKPASWLSSFLHPGKRSTNPSFHLDELDDIAGYFRISIGELLGAAKPGELSGDENRVLLAFRALAPATQAHFVALIEQLSIVPRALQNRVLHLPEDIPHNAQTEASDAPTVPPDATVRAINAAMVILGRAAAAAGTHQSLSGARPDEPPAGTVAR